MSAIQSRLPEPPSICSYIGCEERPVAVLFPGCTGYCARHDAEHRAFEQQHQSWIEAFAERWARRGSRRPMMSDGTAIQWTDATCPLYNEWHGTDQRRRNEGGGKQGGGVSRRVPAPHHDGREVVYELPGMAFGGCVRHRPHAMGWPCAVVSREQGAARSRELHSTPQARTRALVRASAGWRFEAGSAARQLLRRGGPDAPPQHPSVRGLRTRLAGWGQAS